jgi:hypothetical protein
MFKALQQYQDAPTNQAAQALAAGPGALGYDAIKSALASSAPSGTRTIDGQNAFQWLANQYLAQGGDASQFMPSTTEALQKLG